MRGVDLRPSLYVGADDLRAGGAGQVGELFHLIAQRRLASAGEHDPDEVGPLARSPGGDQSLSVLIRAIACSSRASGAVTDSRK